MLHFHSLAAQAALNRLLAAFARVIAMSETDGIIDERRDDVLQTAREVLAGFAELFVRARDNTTKRAELSFRLNEQAISFSEKLALLDGATIALSLTLIGSLVSHSGHVPRHAFLLLVCPAWGLLLLSMYCSWVRMVSIHAVNVAALTATAAEIDKFELNVLTLLVTRLTLEAKNAIVEPVTNPAIEKVLQGFAEASAKVTGAIDAWEKKASNSAQSGSGKSTLSAPFEHVAKWSTALALVLLCLFAVKAVLLF